MDVLSMIKDAQISDCGKYRYRLFRQWEQSERMPVMWIMLNPSTADASIDDPTIRRCVEFSKRWGYGAMFVGNLFAYRATNPKELFTVDDARGPENAYHLDLMAQRAAKIIVAWGNGGFYPRPPIPFCPGGVWHLGLTNSQEPKHPLARGKSFIPYEQPLEVFRGLAGLPVSGGSEHG
jgi:hypothetical protein